MLLFRKTICSFLLIEVERNEILVLRKPIVSTQTLDKLNWEARNKNLKLPSVVTYSGKKLCPTLEGQMNQNFDIFCFSSILVKCV